MSEFQYYEWQTIDRLLTPAEQEAVNGLSSHIDVNASQAVVTYDWGDFKHDPRQVLARYFDAFLYFANWGTRRLMFRFPAKLLDENAIAPYLLDEMVTLTTVGKSHILEIEIEQDDLEWEDFEGELAGLTALHQDILEGDYRCLYLAWLKALALSAPEVRDELGEPPVPAGLGKLTPALQRFAHFFALDRHLIQSAAAASPAKTTAHSTTTWRQALRQLSRAECDDFLLRLLEGESGLRLALRQRLHTALKASPPSAASRPTAAELLAGARQIKQAEAEREAAAAEKRRIAALEKLAQREPQAWHTVETLLMEKRWKAHAEAVEQLQQLRDLADYQKTRPAFNRRMKALREQHAARAALLRRFDQAGLQ